MNIKNKNAIITFDYELFLGRKTGTINNCLIKPTEAILEFLKFHKSKAIFFIDAAFLLFLKEHLYKDFQRITFQLKEIVNIGSSVELHLHPQWLQAFEIDDEIKFKSFKNYAINSLTKDEINDLFTKSVHLLEEITGQKIRCYRAGGFCIEPFNQVKEAFNNLGIKYDFSVVTGAYLKLGEIYDYDFSNSPGASFYSFSHNINEEDTKGSFIELPLSTYSNNLLYKIVNKCILKLTKDNVYGDGIGIQEKSYLSFKTFKQLVKHSKGILTLDQTSNIFFKYLLNGHFRNSDFLVIISHPKIFSPQALKNLEYVAQKYNTLNTDDLENFLSNK